MERLKTLTSLVWMLAVLILLELSFLVWHTAPRTDLFWVTLALIAISCLWLTRLALGALKKLKDNTKR